MPRPRRYLVSLAAIVALIAMSASVTFAHVGPDVVPLNGSEDHGDLVGIDLDDDIVGMAATVSGEGYWLVATDGGVFTFGDAAFHGSAGDLPLVSPVVGMAPTPSGDGYWLVAGDGGVFTYGDAAFHGSAGAIDLARPVVGMATTPTGEGYWLVADDGGVFTHGDAGFHGSAGAIDLDEPVVAMAATSDGNGYWLLGRDGGVFAFGDAEFHGSAVDPSRTQDALSIGSSSGGGYWVLTGDGKIHSFGPVDHDPAPSAVCQAEATRGGAVTPAGVWLFNTPVPIPTPGFTSSATTIEGNSIAEQLAYLQACQTVGDPSEVDFTNPLPGSIVSSRYGFRLHPLWEIVLLHAGTDLVVTTGTVGVPVLAAADGTVIAVNERSAYGNTVLIDHGDRIATVYAHLASVSVSVGDSVSRGDSIGGAGATGFVTGAHLHVEVRVDGQPTNPEPLLGL